MNVQLITNIQQADRIKLTASVLTRFVLITTLFLNRLDAFITLPCQEIRPSLIEKDNQCGFRKREFKELRRNHI